MIYVGMGEQVMRSPMKKMKWEEAYCLPGENKKFTRIACNGKHVLAVTDNYQKHFYEWSNKDLKGEPKISQEPPQVSKVPTACSACLVRSSSTK